MKSRRRKPSVRQEPDEATHYHLVSSARQMNISIAIEAGDWQSVVDLEILTHVAIAAALEIDEKRSIDVLYTDDSSIQVINQKWRGKDGPTNILSFPAAPQPVPAGEVAHLGDLVLGWQTIVREASEAGKPLNHHITHLVIHGTLHLLGFDHETDAEAALMEAREIAILAGMGLGNPYTS